MTRQARSTSHAEHLARIARGWDEAADGYDTYFVPRFAPWVGAAVDAVAAAASTEGPILVPCCGTFPELDTLAARFPGRDIVGIDLSAGMVRRARTRAAHWPNASVVEGDASTIDPRWRGRCAAVVSVFGLQQLPEPARAIRNWLDALRPTGRMAVVYWPAVTEVDGPFALAADVVRPGAERASWEGTLVDALTARGAVVERDEPLSYPISHPDAESFIDAYTRSGPMRALAIAEGEASVSRVREQFLRRAPDGEWTHRPTARLIVARR